MSVHETPDTGFRLFGPGEECPAELFIPFADLSLRIAAAAQAEGTVAYPELRQYADQAEQRFERAYARHAARQAAKVAPPGSAPIPARSPALKARPRATHRVGGSAAKSTSEIDSDPDQPGPLLEAALSYARRGWHVLPLEPGKKTPDGRLVPRGHHNASADEATIRSWWKRSPKANVGISLEPSGLVVLDVDVKDDGWDRSLSALERDLPETLQVDTGSGGMHDFYLRGDAPAARKIRFRPGLDLLGKGYVVAAPSLHPSGGLYEWREPSTSIAALPGVLKHALAAGGPRSSATFEGSEREDYGPADQDVLDRAWQALLELGPSVRGKAGDQTAFRMGTILLRDFALRDDEAWELAKRWNDHFPDNEWTESALATKMRNADRYAQGEYGRHRLGDWNRERERVVAAEPPEPGSWEADLQQALAEVRAALTNKSASGDAPEPLFESMTDILGRDYPPESWLVRDLLRKRGTVMIDGDPKAGKSWAALDVAIALATGTPALGKFETVQQCRVAYFFAEDQARDVRNHTRALLASRNIDGEALRGWLFAQPRGRFLDITKDEDLALIVASVRKLGGVEVLVLDPLRDVHSAEEDASDDMSEVMRRKRLLGELLGCLLVVTHHTTKAETEDPAKAIRGSGAIHGALDGMIHLRKPTGDRKAEFICTATSTTKGARSAGRFRLALSVRDDQQGEAIWAQYRVEASPDASDDARDALQERVDAIVSELHGASINPLKSSLTTDELRRKLKAGDGAVRSACREAAKRGLIKKQGARWDLTEKGVQLALGQTPAPFARSA